MDIWQTDKLLLFLIFFIPGFISIKIYDLLIAGQRRDFSKSISEVIGYSALNFAALSWLIILIHSNNFYKNYLFWYFILIFLILFICPICWPILFIKLSSWSFFAKYIINPIAKPWDFVFSQKRVYWIIVHLKDGRNIGGIYGKQSCVSTYPEDEQIYLEKMWRLDENGKFVEPISKSAGMIILKDMILSIELFSS